MNIIRVDVAAFSAVVAITITAANGFSNLIKEANHLGRSTESIQSELKLIRKDIQAQGELYNYRLSKVESQVARAK